MQQGVQIPRPDNSSKWLLAVIIILFIVIGMLCGCKSPERMMNKYSKLHNKCMASSNADVQAVPSGYCLTNFPPVASSDTSTTYKKGKEPAPPKREVKVDCYKFFKDQIEKNKKLSEKEKSELMAQLEAIRKEDRKVPCPPCPPAEPRVDSFIRTIKTVKIDRAQVNSLTMRLAKSEKEGAGYKGEATTYKRLFGGALSVAFLMLVLIIAHITGRFRLPTKS